MATVAIANVQIGTRHRCDMGDLQSVADSISAVGLLEPIVVTDNNELVCGERRLRACREILGWNTIDAHVVDIRSIAAGEWAENVIRKDFTPEEQVHIGRAIEAEIGNRQGQRTDRQLPGSLPGSTGQETRAIVAQRAGFSDKTYRKAKEIVEAAEAEPERFGKLVDDMNRTGLVSGPHKRLVVARKSEGIRKEPPPLPNKGPYRVIVADPPWPYEKRKEDPSHRATTPYPQMSISQICDLNVAAIAHEDSILWLWVTNHHMREAFEVLDAWGFEQKTILTWDKVNLGTGDWLRGQTEHVLLATRGKPVVELTNQTTLLRSPRRGHSQKPDEFYALVEALCPAPRYAELFQRTSRPNWDGHGDEVADAEQRPDAA